MTAEVTPTPVEPAGTVVPPGVPPEDVWSDSARARIDALKSEAQTYREKLDGYEKLYSNNTELQQFHQAAQNYASGNVEAVQEWLIANAAALQDMTVEDYIAKFQDPEDEDDRPLTRKEAKAMLADVQKASEAQQLQAQTNQVLAHAHSLGYEANSWQLKAVLGLAMEKYDNDLDAAHEEFSKFGSKDEIIAKYVEERQAKARTGLRAAPAAGQVPSTERDMKNWNFNDAEKAGEEYIRSLL